MPPPTMASPTSSGLSSVASTPSITVTDDHGCGELLSLPQAEPEEKPVRPRSIVFEAPAAEVKDFKERPAPKRAGSGILTDLKHQMSSTTNLFHHHHHHKTPAAKTIATSSSGTASPRTPEVQALFSKDTQNARPICPNLAAVNLALESLRASSPSPENSNAPSASKEPDPYISHLSLLAKELDRSRTSSKKALTSAMKARDQGQHEVCRALCLSIVQNVHAERETRVYAYNILSTQASPGQGANYLDEAERIAREGMGLGAAECGRLLEIIEVLREGAVARDGKVKSEKVKEGGKNGNVAVVGQPTSSSAARLDLDAGELDKKLQNLASEEDPKLRRDSLSPKDLLAVPRGDLPSGILTPKTEKIMKWAAKQQA